MIGGNIQIHREEGKMVKANTGLIEQIQDWEVSQAQEASLGR